MSELHYLEDKDKEEGQITNLIVVDQMLRGNFENPMSHPQNKQGDGAYLSSELIYQNFFTIHEAKVQFSTN